MVRGLECGDLRFARLRDVNQGAPRSGVYLDAKRAIISKGNHNFRATTNHAISFKHHGHPKRCFHSSRGS